MMDELFGNVIIGYSRAQAIEDGVLVEVPGVLRRMVGLRVHTVMTASSAAATGADDGRDCVRRMLFVTELAAKAAQAGGDTHIVEFRVPPAEPGKSAVDLVMHLGPGDRGEPVLTIMLPGED